MKKLKIISGKLLSAVVAFVLMVGVSLPVAAAEVTTAKGEPPIGALVDGWPLKPKEIGPASELNPLMEDVFPQSRATLVPGEDVPVRFSVSTRSLIDSAATALAADGRVYESAAFDTAVVVDGVSGGVVKTALLFDLFSGKSQGEIDVARFRLNKNAMAEVLDVTLREFSLDTAVVSSEILTDEAGLATTVHYRMRDSFVAGVKEIQSLSDEEALSAAAVVTPKEAAAVQKELSGVSLFADDTATDGVLYTADFNWNYRHTEDTTNQTGLVFRDGQIQAGNDSKVEYYLESVTMTPMTENGVADTVKEPQTIGLGSAVDEVVGDYPGIILTTYSSGIQIKDIFVTRELLNAIGNDLDAAQTTGNVGEAQRLGAALQSLVPHLHSHVLTATLTGYALYGEYEEDGKTPRTTATDTVNATELAVYRYYAEMCAFREAYANHFGTAANFWTTKNAEDENGTPILGALKTLCNMYPDTFIPFGTYDADGNGEIDMKTEVGLDSLISLLTQGFMAYEYHFGSLLDAKIEDCRSVVTDEMTDLEKLLAIHDWLANNAAFDMSTITAMKDGQSAGSDPSQMTAYGALLYDALGIDGAICLGYAATYYLLAEQIMGLTPEQIDFVMVRWYASIAETSVAGSNSGFGSGIFNETHYFNAVKLGDEWYYIDACYDDIYCEVMTQYRVETDGNISHNYFLFAPTSALAIYEGNIDYMDSAYDGVTFRRKPVLDENGNPRINPATMSPAYETETGIDGKEHMIWYHSPYPDGTCTSENKSEEHRYCDTAMTCEETPYTDNQYERSWFTAACGEIHRSGDYYYYVAGELNSFSAVAEDDSEGFDKDRYDVDMGQIFQNDDPAFGDRLVRRAVGKPGNMREDTADNEALWYREVEFEYSEKNENGETSPPQTGTRKAFTDPYAETLFHYGFGTLGQPKLNEDETPIIGEDGNYVNAVTDKPLAALYDDLAEWDTVAAAIYPDLAHTSGLYNGILYFNFANRIYTLKLADIAGSTYDINLLKEYNDVSYVSDGREFGNENGSTFTGKTFRVTKDKDAALGVVTGKPIAALALEERWHYQPVTDEEGNVIGVAPETDDTGIVKYPTLTVSLGTNFSETTLDDEGKNYRKEAVNYNPGYIAGYSDDEENTNEEFMWCANLTELLPLEDVAADIALTADSVSGVEDVAVAPTCLNDGFSEKRGVATGITIPGTRVTDEGSALGHDYVRNEEEGVWVCRRCLVVDGETHYPHDYRDVTFVWETAGNAEVTCFVEAVCDCGGTASVLREEVRDITAEVTTEPTAEKPGVRTYTAVWTYQGKTYRDTHTESIPALGNEQGGLVLNSEDHFGYMQGYPGGTFGPDRQMTRAEAAVMFRRLLDTDSEIKAKGPSPFSDISRKTPITAGSIMKYALW